MIVDRMHQPCHDLAKRDTILTVEECIISVSLQILKCSRELQERRTWEIKGGNFRVEGL
ncbi:hypothetical protein MtrunA17_Chr6g0486231 [Medicago truncatula]|uniref:Uncharacterized protein n=1 Tax=Medicago truncatula TaxID=3880 RepID=A0A396HQ51_MEDTR|nr:hypothetical protein MtrunA17_Chr6g0486231 [Medicago truncatula]